MENKLKRYIKTKDGIKTSNRVTHELIEDICDAGYFKTLKKGSYVTIGIEWVNFDGRWVDIIDESGRHYSIRPSEVKRVTKELSQADTIEKLVDGFIGVPDKEWFERNSVATSGINYFQKPFDLEYGNYNKDFANLELKNQNGWIYTALEWQRDKHDFIFGYIETDKGLIYVAKMNNEGKLELL